MGVEVVVVGSCNTDLIAYVPRLPARGETITGTRFENHYGGKGANQAVMASRLGSKVAMVTCLGADYFGEGYLSNLNNLGIDCTHVTRTTDASTGVAQICVDEQGANFIAIVPGANHVLSPEDVAMAGSGLKGARVMLCQLEVRAQTTLAALELGVAEGMLTIFNPAPADPNLSNRFLELSDVVCVNETELMLLCSREVDTESEESVHQAALELIARGAKALVVTLGEKGALLVSTDSPEVYKVFPAREVDAVDTVGAGDAFLGSLGAYLGRGLRLDEAVCKAVRIASLSVEHKGAQASFPSHSDLPQDLQLPEMP
ncbi:unnamed protein product [Choristocarpus tenellus]